MTSAFHSELEFRDLNRESPKKIRLMLTTPLVYDSELLGGAIIVPKDFVTDLASIPQFLWSVISPLGPYDAGAVLHDWLYQVGKVNRGQADGVFREAMKVCNVNEAQEMILYRGVRLGGWLAWRRYRQMEKVEVLAKTAWDVR